MEEEGKGRENEEGGRRRGKRDSTCGYLLLSLAIHCGVVAWGMRS